jgi:hypothetical protein
MAMKFPQIGRTGNFRPRRVEKRSPRSRFGQESAGAKTKTEIRCPPLRFRPPRWCAAWTSPCLTGTPLALTGWLEADQAELTVLHRPEDEGALRATGYRFCTSRAGLEPTGAFACVRA